MTRRFAFVFIALLLTQFSAVYLWQQYERQTELMKISSDLQLLATRSITDQRKMLECDIRGFEELMRDGSKIRFAPLLKFVLESYDAYAELEYVDDKFAYRSQVKNLIITTNHRFSNLLRKSGEHIDLGPYQIQDNVARNKANSDEALKELTFKHEKVSGPLQATLANLTTLSYLQTTLNQAMQMFGGKADYIDSYFPVFNADRCGYERGDTVNAIVSIGSYSNFLNPANVKLTVDGQELPVGPDGLAKFQAPAGKRGEHTLNTKVVVTNPLTGEVQTGEGAFTYRVN